MIIINIDTKNKIIRVDTKSKIDNGGVGSGIKGHTTEKEDIKKDKYRQNLFGKEYSGYKGRQAIDILIKEKQGYVKGAFSRKDIGDIDLVWGDNSYGLQHILKRRKEENQNFKSLMDGLTDTIENGNIEESHNKLIIKYKGKTAVVEPNFKNLKIQLVITAYYDY